MLALFRLIHVVVVDPAPSMADDLVAILEERLHRRGALLHRADYTEDADFDVEFLEYAKEAPHADPRAIFEYRLDDRAAYAEISGETDVAQ